MDDNFYEIALNLSYNDVINFTEVNRRFNRMCGNRFWYDKYVKDYDNYDIRCLIGNFNWKFFY